MLIAKTIVGLVLAYVWIKMVRMDARDRRLTSEKFGDLTW